MPKRRQAAGKKSKGQTAKKNRLEPLPISRNDIKFDAEDYAGTAAERNPSPSSKPSVATTVAVESPKPEPLSPRLLEPSVVYSVGEMVHVSNKRRGVGFLEHGIAKVLGYADGCYDVKFTMGSRDKKVPHQYVEMYDMFGDRRMLEEAKRESIGETCGLTRQNKGMGELVIDQTTSSSKSSRKIEPVLTVSSSSEDDWLRRSRRTAGKDQLMSERTLLLLKRLYDNKPDDEEIKVLRLKNFLDANVNKQVLLEVLEAIQKNTNVQALYIQNMEGGFDDEVLYRLVEVLRARKNIWCLNVGENFKVTRQGWEDFAEGLRDTHITHMYAGSETTVNGKLKIKMRDVIRDNRSKHSLHRNPSNIGVIQQIGQMWWNPKNAKCLQKYLTSEERNVLDHKIPPMIGRRVSIYHGGHWRIGRIAKYDEGQQAHLLVWVPKERKFTDATPVDKLAAWVYLPDHEYLLSDQIMWGQRDPGDKMDHKKLQIADVCEAALTKLLSLPACRPFLTPLRREKQCLDYDTVVDSPLDLKTVKSKLLRRNEYLSVKAVGDDVRKVFNDCVNFLKDRPVDPYRPLGKWAAELLEGFEADFQTIEENYACLTITDGKKRKLKPEELPWEPVQVFRHCPATMPDEAKREVELQETCVLYLSKPRTWLWYPNELLFPFDIINRQVPIGRAKRGENQALFGETPTPSLTIFDPVTVSAALAEHEIFMSTDKKTTGKKKKGRRKKCT